MASFHLGSGSLNGESRRRAGGKRFDSPPLSRVPPWPPAPQLTSGPELRPRPRHWQALFDIVVSVFQSRYNELVLKPNGTHERKVSGEFQKNP